MNASTLLDEGVSPRRRMASVSVDRKLRFDLYAHLGYTWRYGPRGFVFNSTAPESGPAVFDGAVYQLVNRRHDRYDAVDFSVRHTFAGQFECGFHEGYLREGAHSSSPFGCRYSLEGGRLGRVAPPAAGEATPRPTPPACDGGGNRPFACAAAAFAPPSASA